MNGKCSYRGPEFECLPEGIVRLVHSAMDQLPEAASLLVEKTVRRETGLDTDYRVNFCDFKLIYIATLDDTDLERVVVFDATHQYNIIVDGNLPKNSRRQALEYNQEKLWTLAIPGDSFMDILKGRVNRWIEALPKDETKEKYHTLGRRRTIPQLL